MTIGRQTARWRRAPATVAIILVAVAASPAAVSAGGPPPIFAGIGECRAGGTGPPNQTLVFTWHDAAGRLKSRQTLTINGGGEWLSHCEPTERIEIGDQMTRTIAGVTRQLTIPRLTARVDRVTDVVNGRAPAGSTVRIEVFGRLGTASDEVTAGPAGNYSRDFTAEMDLFGSDVAVVEWQNAGGSRVYTEAVAPYVTVYRGESQFQVQTAAGKQIQVTLRDGATLVGTGNGTGPSFSGDFRDPQGDPIAVQAGDTVRAVQVAGDVDFVVPAVQLGGNAATDVLTGKCLPNARFGLLVQRRNGSASDAVFSFADGGGNVSVDFTGFYDVRRGDKARLECHVPAGDIVVRRLTVA